MARPGVIGQGGGSLSGGSSPAKPRGTATATADADQGHELFRRGAAPALQIPTRSLAVGGCAGRMPIGLVPPGNVPK